MTCPIGTILRCPTADERRIEYYHSLGMTAMQIAGVMENWLAPTDEAIARSEAIISIVILHSSSVISVAGRPLMLMGQRHWR